MKKYLMFFLFLTTFAYSLNLTAFGGTTDSDFLRYQIKYVYSEEDPIEMNIKPGFAYGLEIHHKIKKTPKNKFEIGLGTRYDSVVILSEKDLSTGDCNELFSTRHIYGSGKYTFNPNKKFGLFLQAKLGSTKAFEKKDLINTFEYNTFNYGLKSTFEGGFFIGLGAGIEINDFYFGISHDGISAVITEFIDGDNFDGRKFHYMSYYPLTLSFGYKVGS